MNNIVNFIVGRSGYGKSSNIMSEIGVNAENRQNIIILVPDQFSFETERLLYTKLGAEKTISIEVLSFSRLTNIIFRDYGGLSRRYISKGGKSLLSHMAISEVKDYLEVYKNMYKNKSFIEKITATISEFKQSSVTPEELHHVSENIFADSLKEKSKDISLIFDAYNSLLQKGYDDSDDNLSIALDFVRDKGFFAGKTVFIDEFKGFTADEFNMIKEIMIQAEDVYISFCIDDMNEKDNGLGLFSYVKKTAIKLKRFIKDNGVLINEDKILDIPKRYKVPELIHLEKNLFSPGKNEEYFNDSAISIFQGDNVYHEIEFVCAKIKELVRKENIMYKEIAVIGRDIADYETALSMMMARYNIPYFYSLTENVYNKPFLMFITCIINAGVTNYDNDSIFSALKTGLTSLLPEEIAELENYIYTWDIKGAIWENDFTQNPRGFQAEKTEEDYKVLERLNNSRKHIISPIINFKNKTKETINGISFVRALYGVIDEMNISENYAKIIKNLDNTESKSEYKQIWDLFIDVLDEFSDVLKNTFMPAKDINELFLIMIENMEIGEIPQHIDEVLVGDAALTRPNNPKVTFIIGANEGVFPKIPESKSIFTDEERKILIENNINISDDLENKIIDERFIFYKALTSPAEKLFITYPLYNIKGAPARPSVYIDELKKICGGTLVINRGEFEKTGSIENELSALYSISKNYNVDTAERATIKSVLNYKKDYIVNVEYLEKVIKNISYEINNKDLAKRLYGSYMKLSPSRVEKFMGCKFAYYAQYGLKLEERKKAKLSPMEIGSLVHYALEVFMQKYDDITILDERTIRREITIILDSYIELYMGGVDDKNSRFRYLYKRLTNTIFQLIEHLKSEFSQSLFKPLDFELKISKDSDVEPMKMLLPDGGSIFVEGIVDRVDVMEKDGEKYIRVVDYKTGGKDFRLSDVYHGLSMQMLIYLFSIWKNGKGKYENIIPAGVLYMPAKASAMDMERSDDNNMVEDARKKTFRMQGLVLDDIDIINGMDKGAKGVYINVSVKKDGTPSKKSTVANLEKLGKLQKHVEKLIIKMGEDLHKGQVEAEPIKVGQHTSCSWCSYKSICGHEENDGYDEIKTFNNEEVFEKIEEELKNEQEK